MKPKYTQAQFDSALLKILKRKKKEGLKKARVVSCELHRLVARSGDNRMPMACNAMWALYNKVGGDIIHTTPSNMSSTIEIEYVLSKIF